VCPYWARKGTCAFGDNCFYAHPAVEADVGSVAAPGGGGSERRSKKRESKNRKFGAFRRWLLDEFGAQQMSAGAGVLDVAGGKGELSFELLNLNSVPTTVIDPRVVLLTKVAKKLRAGLYGSSSVHEAYLDRPAHDRNLLDPLLPQHLKMYFDGALVSGRLHCRLASAGCHHRLHEAYRTRASRTLAVN
jgi:hypothetical protein